MRGLGPRIHVFSAAKTWMAGTRPAMTIELKHSLSAHQCVFGSENSFGMKSVATSCSYGTVWGISLFA
jgi:hypothetical protein